MVLGEAKSDPENTSQLKNRSINWSDFNQKFIEKNGSFTCKDLLGCDQHTEGQAYLKSKV
jgi:hypothetical protein